MAIKELINAIQSILHIKNYATRKIRIQKRKDYGTKHNKENTLAWDHQTSMDVLTPVLTLAGGIDNGLPSTRRNSSDFIIPNSNGRQEIALQEMSRFRIRKRLTPAEKNAVSYATKLLDNRIGTNKRFIEQTVDFHV